VSWLRYSTYHFLKFLHLKGFGDTIRQTYIYKKRLKDPAIASSIIVRKNPCLRMHASIPFLDIALLGVHFRGHLKGGIMPHSLI
jgi:hypothetical protein